MNKTVLVLNAGSSSLKFSIFDAAENLTLMAKGQIEGIGVAPRFVAETVEGENLIDIRWNILEIKDHRDCLARLNAWLDDYLDGAVPYAVGHRVAHGGDIFSKPVVVKADIISKLDELTLLAPLHQPHNLAGIRAVAAINPNTPQVACFDTAFHRGRNWVTDAYALPYEMYEEGIRRYGFHGTSYEYIARKLRDIAPNIAKKKVVVAHLGNGASMCAINDGKSVATTMGFTPIDGLPMGTRSGQLDPGVLLYLMERRNYDVKKLETLLYKNSGLKGISGVGNDLRALMASDEPRAKLAVDYFVHRVSRELGSLAASLQGLDALVFTAGIGEHSAIVRERVCKAAGWLGVELDQAANESHAQVVSGAESKVRTMVVPTDEELMIAIHTLETLDAQWNAFGISA